jgi:hypothetical protein
MPRRSKFHQLPDELKEELGKLYRSGRFSIDELLARLRELGEADISRSGLHRGLQAFAKTTEQYRRAQEYAAFVIEKLGAKPDNDVARLVSELIKTQAFDALVMMAERSDGAVFDPENLHFLARMLKDVTAADKNTLDYRQSIAKLALQAAAKAADAVVKERGLSDEDANLIRARILGVKVAGNGAG